MVETKNIKCEVRKCRQIKKTKKERSVKSSSCVIMAFRRLKTVV